MPQCKSKVFVNARFDVIWQKSLEKIIDPSRYVDDIEHAEILEQQDNQWLRLIRFKDPTWQQLKELIVADKSTGIIVYRLVDHPSFQGETIHICRTTNQVYQSELEYELNWKLKDTNQHESQQQIDNAQQTLQLALNHIKRIAEEEAKTDQQ